MDNTDDAADLNIPLDKVWERFVTAESFLDILNKFETLKQRLDISTLTGMPLFEAFKLKLCTQKTWKARDVLNLLDSRAKQKAFMNQVHASVCL